MQTLVIWLAVGIISAGILFSVKYIYRPDNQCPDFKQEHILVGDKTIAVGIARTAWQKAQGLSGCSNVPDNHGLLFTMNPERPASFWMKGMLIPIDIIWISDGRIIKIDANLPVPTPGQPLEKYSPPRPVDYVLEVAAGQAQELGLTPNSPVIIDI